MLHIIKKKYFLKKEISTIVKGHYMQYCIPFFVVKNFKLDDKIRGEIDYEYMLYSNKQDLSMASYLNLSFSGKKQ